MNYQAPEPHLAEPARIAARALASHYAELGGIESKPAPRFCVARYLGLLASGRSIDGYEAEVLTATATAQGQLCFDPARATVPWAAFATRTMTSVPGAKGGYLAGLDVTEPVDVLRPWSVTASAGMHVMPNLTNPVQIPRAATTPTGAWIGEAGAAQSESPPTLGGVSMTPKTGMATVRISLQLLKQAESTEPFVRALLLAAAGELIDTAVLTGTGGQQPIGLLNTPGIGTQSGTSLGQTGLAAMRRLVLAAGGRESNLSSIGAPTVQETLSLRERVASGGRHLWDVDGVLGRPAYSTKTAPASTLVMGDFSQSVLGIWGPGMRIDVDPSQDFNSGGIVVRVMMFCDVAFQQPAAFAVATSIT